MIICFPFIEVDDNFDPPELMDDDVLDYNDDSGNNVVEEAEVKCRIVQSTSIKIKIRSFIL